MPRRVTQMVFIGGHPQEVMYRDGVVRQEDSQEQLLVLCEDGTMWQHPLGEGADVDVVAVETWMPIAAPPTDEEDAAITDAEKDSVDLTAEAEVLLSRAAEERVKEAERASKREALQANGTH